MCLIIQASINPVNQIEVHFYNQLHSCGTYRDNEKLMLLLTLNIQGRINSVQHSQYHGDWCPGSLRRQDISTNDIHNAE